MQRFVPTFRHPAVFFNDIITPRYLPFGAERPSALTRVRILLQDQRNRDVSRVKMVAGQVRVTRGNLRLFFGGSGGRTALRTMLETAVGVRDTGVDPIVCGSNGGGCDISDRLLRTFECISTKTEVLTIKSRKSPCILLIDTRTSTNADRDVDSWSEIERWVASGFTVWAAIDTTGFSSWTTVGAGIPARLKSLSLL